MSKCKDRRHATIPVFVPHLACPNDCVFCNQKHISGTQEPVKDVKKLLSDALDILGNSFSEVDIAFFGGSFTGIGEKEMRRYLSAAAEARERDGRITGIRLSTRPDYIDNEILDILCEYGVTNVELGAQSMCDEVLNAAGRGHTSDATRRAAKLIKERGITLGLQMMTGLPGDSPERDIYSAREMISLSPSEARIYPCVVIKDTALEKMYYAGTFRPQTVEEAVEICATLTEMYEKAGVKLLRVGLHSSDIVRDNSVVAGPFHPAFGELVTQRRYLEKERELLRENTGFRHFTVPKGELSKALGNKRGNYEILTSEFGSEITFSEGNTDKIILTKD